MQSEMSGITKLHRQHAPLTRKTWLWVIIPNVSRPCFRDRCNDIHTHGWIQLWKEKKKSNKIKKDTRKTRWLCRSPFTSHQISSLVPPIPAPKRPVLKFLLVKVLDLLLLSPVMDNVYHGHDKLFPHKWFCHGLLLAVMWDSACRLKQP